MVTLDKILTLHPEWMPLVQKGHREAVEALFLARISSETDSFESDAGGVVSEAAYIHYANLEPCLSGVYSSKKVHLP